MRIPTPRPLVATAAGFAVALSTLAAVSVATPAQADVSTKISTFPYVQDWSNTAMITANDDWAGVQGVAGYLGDVDPGSPTNVDPSTVLVDNLTTDVIANQSSPSITSGGVAEFDGIADPTIALQGSGTADAPNLVFHLDLSGRAAANIAYDVRDIDPGADDAVQQVALQYRIGTSGDYTSIPEGYVADATEPNSATKVTPVTVTLPTATDGQSDVFVRVITTNAVGSDEWVGIDNIKITADEATGGLVINEVYGGGGNSGATFKNDFVELRNTSSRPIALTGKSLQYRSATGTGMPGTSNFLALPAKVVPPGETFLVGLAAGNGSAPALPAADASGSINLSGTGGQIFLAESTDRLDPNDPAESAGTTFVTAVVDFVGWGSASGNDTTSFEGTRGPQTANASSLSRDTDGVDTDDNGADFTVSNPPTPVACTGCNDDDVVPLEATNPGDQTFTVDQAITDVALSATGGTPPYSWDVSGLPAGLGETDGVIGGTPTETGSFPVTATVTDSATEPASKQATFTITVNPAVVPGADSVLISEVYGAGGFAQSGDLPASTYQNDFIELYNPTDSAIDLEGWAVFYGSATRSAGGVANGTLLEGSIPAHGYFLIAQSGGTNGEPLPTPDVTGTVNLGAGSGLVVLSNQTANLTGVPTGSIVGTPNVVDAVGYGTANTFETANQGTTLSGVTSAQRVPVDSDTDDNTADFDVAAPTPTSSETPGTVDDLVITEVYGGGGNSGATFTNDFIELYNPTSTPIDLDGLSVQGRTPASTNQSAPSSGNITPLTGVIPPQGYWLIEEAAGSSVLDKPLPDPDTEGGTMAMAAGGWQVWLARGTDPLNPPDGHVSDPQIIDFVGAATSSKSFETAAVTAAPSATLSQTRNAANVDTDHNANDFSTATPDPRNSQFTTGGLSAKDPSDVQTFVDEPVTPITLQATGGTPGYTWAVTGLPDGLSATNEGVISGTPTTTGVSNVTATVTDSATPDAATATLEFTIAVNPPSGTVFPIAEVQGTGAESPVNGLTLTTHGVVTARYPSGAGSMAGFVIQTGGEDGVDYDTPGASDAVFVFSGNKTAPAIGETVEVRGVVDERFGSTQINASGASATITVLGTPQPPVVPNDVIPGTDCEVPDCPTAAELDELRESHEHEAFQPTGPYTVTDAYDGSVDGFGMLGEIGLAAERDLPLMIPTETIDQSDTTAIAEMRAYNAARLLILDDAKSTNYANVTGTAFPWFTADRPVRTGAPVTFPKPVILKYDFGAWRILPQQEVAGGEDGQGLVAIENTRPDNLAPEDVLGATGDLKIATFNMLNYFNTFGEEWAASDGTDTGGPGSSYNFGNPRRCNYYTDRDRARITNDTCEQDAVDPLTGLNVKLPGPRGAANITSFLRQEAKLVNAINTIDADVMSLEEVENSIKLYDPEIDTGTHSDADRNRDDALQRLVSKLNEAAGDPGRWALAESPRPQALPTVQEQDAIRNAFIYNPQTVELVGPSQVLVNSPAMRNAREPLAQAFRPLGGGRNDAFLVIVNHFKSKSPPQDPSPPATGDNADAGDGAGFYNGDRKRQAQALVAFANQVAADKNIGPVFLTGDFNSYSAEDPVQVIEAAGYTNLKPDDGSTSYNFGGLAGSLDHVFANDAAAAMVTGEDIWEINANEAVYYEYSRFNYNAAQLYDTSVFRSSDHNPEIIGIDVGDLTADPVVDTVQILATNDFHGRLLDDPGSAAAGAASMAKAVKELRSQNDSTIFSAAGDLIGASTFESFIQDDEPTIDALNEAGLEVSAVGNHEFDQGYDDLVERVMPRADWEYLGANVEFKHTEDGHQAGDPALPETWCNTLPNGRTIGFVGAVTEDLPTLVSSQAIEDVVVTDVVESVNEHADDLKGPDGCGAGDPADLVVMLVHEGAATTSIGSVTDDSTFGRIVSGANANIDAIVSGHTHLAYNHKVEVPEWVDEGRDVTRRPVVSAGQYGANLNRLQFEFEDDELVNVRQTVLRLKDYDADPATQAIVDEAVEYADEAGSAVLGDIEDRFLRARRIGDDGQIVEHRGGESTLGNLIAEVQRWKTGADIGFMNPGGLRADIEGSNGTPREVTYREAANAQPFANTLVTMDLTGAQVKAVLEEQWQRDEDGNIPSRAFLRLGTSEGFSATFDATRPEGNRVTGMFLDGVPLDPEATYKVSATSFLAGAGDNFWTLADGQNLQDTGRTDLQAVVDYLAEFGKHGVEVLPVGYDQRQVGVTVKGTAPFVAGDSVTLDVSSLAMTGVDDEVDSEVVLKHGDTVLATSPVTGTELSRSLDDDRGTATLTFDVPDGVDDGTTYFMLVGATTGTEVPVGIPTDDGFVDATVAGVDQTVTFGEAITIPVTVAPSDATGSVTLMQGNIQLGHTSLDGGNGSITLPAGSLAVGVYDLTLAYSGDDTYDAAAGSVTVTVTEVSTPVPGTGTTASATCPEVTFGTDWTAQVVITPRTATGTVTVRAGGTTLGSAALSNGAAAVAIDGEALPPGTHALTISYAGSASHASSQTTCSVTVDGPGEGETVTSVSGVSVVRYGTGGSVTVTITGEGPVTGTVELLKGATLLDSATLPGGAAARGRATAGAGTVTLTIPPTALPVGRHTLTVRYLGDERNEPSGTTVQVRVLKAKASLRANVRPKRIVAGRTMARMTVRVTAPGQRVTGKVRVKWRGQKRTVVLRPNGRVTVALGRWQAPGRKKVTVRYLGSRVAAPTGRTVRVRVVPGPRR